MTEEGAEKTCRHCLCRPGHYGWGLCRRCSRDGKIRTLYAERRKPAGCKCRGSVDCPVHGRRPCRHCETGWACRAKGLCWTCAHKPEVRDSYPAANREGAGARASGRKTADVPCPYPPGSQEKIAVLAKRAEQGLCLWHPLDAGPPEGRTDLRPRETYHHDKHQAEESGRLPVRVSPPE